MRKIGPAFVLSAIVALTSGSALALGDKAKEKKSSTASTPAVTQPAGTLSGTATTTATAPNASTHGTVGAQASTGVASSTNSANVSPAPSSTNSTIVASADKPMVKDKAKNPNRDKCINLKPTDPKWAQHDCGAGGDGGSSAGSAGSGAAGGAAGSSSGSSSGSGGSSK